MPSSVAASPDFVLAALGSPKQEIWIHRVSSAYPGVAMGVRASFDFQHREGVANPSLHCQIGSGMGVWTTCFETRNSW